MTTDTSSSGRSAWKRVLTIFVAALSYAVAHFAVDWWRERHSIEKASEIVGKKLDDLVHEASKDTSGKDPVMVVQETAIKQSSKALSEKSGADKADEAAMQFIGFYYLNTRTRSDYCRSLGVDISSFISEFSSLHRTLHAKSAFIASKSGLTLTEIEGSLYTGMADHFNRMVKMDMEAIARMGNASTKEACQWFGVNGEVIAREMHVGNVNPALYNALVEAR